MDCGNRDTKCGDGDSCAGVTRASGNGQTPLTPLPCKLESSWHQDNAMVRSRFGHYYPICLDNKLETQQLIQMGWSGEMRILLCCDVWRVTGCVTRHISIRCETRGAGNVITTLHTPHSESQTVSQPAPALSHAVNVKMSISLHFKWELFSDGRTDAVASLIFYWNPTLQLWIASLVRHSKLSEPWHENTHRDWDPAL